MGWGLAVLLRNKDGCLNNTLGTAKQITPRGGEGMSASRGCHRKPSDGNLKRRSTKKQKVKEKGAIFG